MRLGCRGDDAGRRALLQPLEEELAEQKRCQARFAPSAASASGAAKPMPLVAPVIRMCLAFTAQQSHNRSRDQAGRQPSSNMAVERSSCAILVRLEAL